MKEGGPAVFVVEERSISFGAPYIVDLTKAEGQQGYIESVHGV
jgi:hypothetical protein